MVSLDEMVIKNEGRRGSKVRTGIVRILKEEAIPLSAQQIHKNLAKFGLRPNKTTIYRSLEVLKQNETIRELQFGEAIMRYEITPRVHHHHVICNNCQRVEDISELSLTVPQIKNFKILTHSLEFYGICQNCNS